ncbi:hypothetical protein AAFN85_31535 [Mucilaginibacter sp. CAU 1740]|uniref:hypothetical protein n=1 Tax=Mucilaginibacter sp. CAU 1740 TaxID=3140365 RepID=UPI00325AC18D
MTDGELDDFLELFTLAVSKVEGEYMRTIYHEMGYVVSMIRQAHQRRNMRRGLVDNDIVRTGERIFCYELYHQLRLLMESMRERFPQLFLQGELRKYQVPEMLQALELDALDANYMPDFLLHIPGNADDHPYVIEVKTDPELDGDQLTTDIKKIMNFMHAYRYQRGIFLAVNIRDTTIDALVRGNAKLWGLPHIEQYAADIIVINIAREHDRPTVRRLNSWLA